MPLEVEDGSAKAGAETYASVGEADAYHSGRGNHAWAPIAEIAKERALRRAADYLGETYGTRWQGVRAAANQALDWPRQGAPVRDGPAWACYASDEVPPEVRRACMELALRALSGALAPDRGQAVKRERAGSVEMEYQDGSTALPAYPQVDRLLAPLLVGTGGPRLARG